MGLLDTMKERAAVGAERGMNAALAARDALRGGAVSTGGAGAPPVTPTAAAPEAGGAAIRTAQAAKAAGTLSPEAAAYNASLSGGAGAPPTAPPVAPAPAAAPGFIDKVKGLGRSALSLGGNLAGAAAGGYGAYKAGEDVATHGANVGNTTDFAGNAALAGGSVAGLAGATAGAPVAVGAGAFLAGKGIGSAVTDYIGKPLVDAATDKYARSQLNPEFQKQVDAAGGMDAYLKAHQNPQAAAAPAVAAPAPASAPGANGLTFLEQTNPAEAARVAQGIRSREITLANTAPGTGYVATSGGKVTRIDTPQPTAAAAPAPVDPRQAVIDTLTREMQPGSDPLVGRRRRIEAATALSGMLQGEGELGIKRSTAQRDSAKFNADLGDKRMKDFQEQHVNNQFYTKDDKGKDVPDQVKNAQFQDFMRQTDPRFGTAAGMAEITQLSPQNRNKLVSDLRKSFLEKEQVETQTNNNAWFSKPGLSNAPVQVGGTREATIGDIPQIGLKNYLWSNLPGTNRDVVDTDRGAVPAEDYIGDGEDSRSRRAKIYPKKGL